MVQEKMVAAQKKSGDGPKVKEGFAPKALQKPSAFDIEFWLVLVVFTGPTLPLPTTLVSLFKSL